MTKMRFVSTAIISTAILLLASFPAWSQSGGPSQFDLVGVTGNAAPTPESLFFLSQTDASATFIMNFR